MNEQSPVKERLLVFLHHLGVGQSKFEKACGLANGYVNNIRKSITHEKLQQIALCYPDLNTAWLITGEGEMLRTSGNTVVGDVNQNLQVGDNAGSVSQNSSSLFEKALGEIAEERKAWLGLMTKKDEQTDRLISMLETMMNKQP